jgi:hypothetical protein
MSVHADSRVDDYIGGLPDWQQAVCLEVRRLVHAADPDVEETVKRSVRPYFVLQGNICALLAARDHVNVFIYDPTVDDPHGIINQGHGNATARAVQIYHGDTINSPALLAMFRAVIANNRVGGWRRIRSLPPRPRQPAAGRDQNHQIRTAVDQTVSMPS